MIQLLSVYILFLLVDVDSEEVASRIMAYITEASYVVQLPFAEVVLTYKDKGSDFLRLFNYRFGVLDSVHKLS